MLRQPIRQVVESPSSVLAALWSASGYIGAFGRALNRIYEIGEGRPMGKLRPLQLVLTFLGLVLAAGIAFMLAASCPIARAVGNAIGLGNTAQLAWAVVKWPVILVRVAMAVWILYFAAPKVTQPKFRWLRIWFGGRNRGCGLWRRRNSSSTSATSAATK